MSLFAGNSWKCSGCAATYGTMRTGLTYRDVWLMLWHRTEWRYKRRGTVLGLWHQIKRSMWENHVETCHPRKGRRRERRGADADEWGG